jgi:hypothetical protein
MLCQDRDLQAITVEKRQFAGTMNAKINNVIYMELYSGAKMVDDKYEIESSLYFIYDLITYLTT